MEILTSVYRSSASRCGRKAALDILARWWWAFAIPLIAAAVAAFWDWRWLAVAFALGLVLYPFVLMLAFYSQALAPEAAKALLPKQARLSDSGVDLTYFPIDENTAALPPERIGRSEILSCSELEDSIVIRHARGHLSIPLSAFNSKDLPDLLVFSSLFD
ncbi:MAG: hypothetical protein NC102_08230 [Clostridium sp.]|nr:hypothetical protein [Clostridium sp.]